MNFLAHALVAARTGTRSPERLVGAVLPDLAGMAGCRPAYDALPPEVRDGVACHHRADRAFHADRAFTEGARRLRAAGEGAGLPRGAARAVGHLGWELLLDGQLVGRPEAAALFSSALHHAAAADAAFAAPERPRWHGLVDHLAGSPWWRRYDDPDVVAEALARRLRSRPRLAFAAGEVPVVARLLHGVREDVATATPAVLDRVVAVVAADTPADPPGSVGVAR